MPATLLKRDAGRGVFLLKLWNFKSTYFEENLLTAASVCSNFLRILTGKNHPQIKLQHLRKVWIWTFGFFVHQINYFYEILKLKQNFRKDEVATGKTLFFVIGLFCTPHFVLTMASDRAVLCLRCQSQNFQLKNDNPVFSKGFEFFR